jgi:hypothetical protein
MGIPILVLLRYFLGPVMFVAYAIYMIALKVMARKGFKQVSNWS